MTPILNYQLPTVGEVNTNSSDSNKVAGYTNQIDSTQKFVAVGPAVLKGDWYSTVNLLGGQLKDNANWQYDPNDPVRYLAAPSNLAQSAVNLFNPKIESPIYIPNLWDLVTGISHLKDIKDHSVTNDMYKKFIDPTVEQKLLNPINAPPVTNSTNTR